MIYLTADDLAAMDEDQVILAESTGVGAMPDLSGDYDLVMQFESLLNSAEFIRIDLAAQGGMSRTLAMEMFEVWPDLKERRPLTFYTNQPSRTLLTASMEEIHLGIAAGIAAAFAALLVAIWKLWKWIRGGKDSPNDAISAARTDEADIKADGKKAAQAVEEVKALDSALQAAPQQIVAAAVSAIEDKAEAKSKAHHNVAEVHVAVTDHHSKLVTAALKLVAAEHYTLVSMFGSLEFHDILNEGPWTKASSVALHAFRSREADLRARLEKLKTVVKHDPTQLTTEDFRSIQHLSDEQEGRNAADVELERLADEAMEHHRAIDHKGGHETVDLTDAGVKLNTISQSSLIGDLTATRVAILEVSSEFQTMENLLKPYGDKDVIEQIFGDDGHHQDTVHALKRLRTEVMALNKLMGTYYNLSCKHVNALKRYTRAYSDMVNRIGTITVDEFERAGKQAEKPSEIEQVKTMAMRIRGLFKGRGHATNRRGEPH